jgi:hypothetical protein
MSDVRWALAWTVSVGVALGGCGASPPPPAASPPTYPAADAPGTRPPSRPDLDQRVDATESAAESDAATAAARLEQSEHEVQSAQGCDVACRALASMRRAAEELCLLSRAPDDQARCDAARRRVVAAQDRVRRTCGECPAR